MDLGGPVPGAGGGVSRDLTPDADVQAATEKAVAVAKQGVDLGVAAQQRVVELVSQRVKANVDELKTIAA